MKIKLSYKNVLIYIYTWLYFFSFYCPAAFEKNSFIISFTLYYKLFSFIVALIWYVCLLIKRRELDSYDCIIILLNFFFILNIIFNIEWRTNIINRMMRIDASVFILKCAMISLDTRVRDSFIYGASGCLAVLSICNIIDVITFTAHNGFVDGYITFWTYDNKCIGYYLIALFFLYIKKFCINKMDYFFYLEIGIIFLHTLLLRVTTGWIVIIALGCYCILYHMKTRQNCIFLRIDKMFIWLITVMLILLLCGESMEPIINAVFAGKYSSILSRTQLWNYFLNMTLKSPVWGNGVWSEKDIVITNLYGVNLWKAIGNSHNMYIEILYQFGIPAFLLTFLLVFVSAKRNVLHSKKIRFMSGFVFAFMIEGFVELGFSSLFLFIPMLFYSDRLEKIEEEKKC